MLVAVLCTRLLTYVGGSAVYETTHLCWWQCCVLLTYVGSSAVYYSPMLVAVLYSVYYSVLTYVGGSARYDGGHARHHAGHPTAGVNAARHVTTCITVQSRVETRNSELFFN